MKHLSKAVLEQRVEVCLPRPTDLLLLTSSGEEKGSQVFCSWLTPTAFPPWSKPPAQSLPSGWEPIIAPAYGSCPASVGSVGCTRAPVSPLLGTSVLHPCKSNRNYKAASQLVPWQVFKLCLRVVVLARTAQLPVLPSSWLNKCRKTPLS